MGLLPLEFTDALQDSPYFRSDISCLAIVAIQETSNERLITYIDTGTVCTATRKSWKEQVTI